MPVFAKLDQKLLRDLWRIKGQVLAIVLVIASGLSLLVMSRGMTHSLDETMRAYYDRYRFADIYAPVKRAPRGVLNEIQAVRGVSAVNGRISGAGLVDLPSFNAPISARILSLEPDRQMQINDVHLVDGALPDIERPDDVLLLEPFAQAHGLSPGDSLSIIMYGQKHAFRIAGLALSPEFTYAIPPGEFAVDASRFAVIWANRETMAAAYDMDGAFNEAVLLLGPRASSASVINAIDQLLKPYGAVGAYGRADQISNKYLVEELKQLRSMGRIMTPIFLGVSIFLLNIVVTRLVQTEREQIGLLKAFGYSNLDVGVHYLKFAGIICLLGGLVGWLAGLWLGRVIAGVYQLFYNFPFLIFEADLGVALELFVMCILTAAIGAFVAVRGAVRLTPAEAMRPPAPPSYTKAQGAIIALSRLLDQPSRMILRRLTQHPIKAALTVVGIGAAMGLSVMMRYNLDATDEMININFNIADRSDVFVTFAEPLSKRSLYALRSIDGVSHVEPSRAVPVTFVADRTEYLGAINGLTKNPKLNRALDEDLREVEVSGAGLVLSSALAEILEVSVGDRITVAVREGRQPVFDIAITGLVDSLLGTPAFMQIEALNRVLYEPRRVSGAYLKVAEPKRQAVYNELKNVPMVVGVSLHREAHDNFQDMIDEGPGVFQDIMTAVSIIIAVGVVYNSARIAFIERGRDLASLRVLGFTKLESGYVLLGEIFLLMMIALPVGALFGLALWTYVADAFSTDLYRIPVVHNPPGLGKSAIIVVIATVISCLLVQRDVSRLDITSALKTKD